MFQVLSSHMWPVCWVVQAENISIITERPIKTVLVQRVGTAGRPSRKPREPTCCTPHAQRPAAGSGLPSSAGLLGPPQLLSRLPATPNTLPTPACHLLAHPGTARHLASTSFPAPGVLPLAGGGHGRGARLGTWHCWLRWTGRALTWAHGIYVIHQEKVVVWQKLGSCWRLSYWTS